MHDVQRRQRSKKKRAVERGSRRVKHGTLYCGDDIQRTQRSKEKNDADGTVREIGLGVLHGTLYCGDDIQRTQRSKEKNDADGTVREIGLGVLLYASKRAKRIGQLGYGDSTQPSRKGWPTKAAKTERLDSCNSAQLVKSGGYTRTSKIERPGYH